MHYAAATPPNAIDRTAHVASPTPIWVALAGLVLAVGFPGAASAQGDAPKKNPPASAKTSIHAPFDTLLKNHVKDGVVDYAGLKPREGELFLYLKVLAQTDPAALGNDDRLALWINAYNAFTLMLILRNYPGLESIKDIPSRWSKREWKVNGRWYSLEQIEHEVIRKDFQEPRIHFAINCASKSCPDLRSEAYEGSQLDAQLAEQTKRFLTNSTKGLKTVARSGFFGTSYELHVSKIFDWFEEDFEQAKGSVPDYVLPYARGTDQSFIRAHRSDLDVEYLDYDWTLNGK